KHGAQSDEADRNTGTAGIAISVRSGNLALQATDEVSVLSNPHPRTAKNDPAPNFRRKQDRFPSFPHHSAPNSTRSPSCMRAPSIM
ncbi:MAG: hypothetical protein ACI4XW_03425, partial [Candidatus Spyradocola sp.]